MKSNRFAIIGYGRIGRALAAVLQQNGHHLSAIIDQNIKTVRSAQKQFPGIPVTSVIQNLPDVDIIFITVNDDAISTVVEKLANDDVLLKGRIVVHTSGALSSDILAQLAGKGALLASMHPVQTFSGSPTDVEKFRNSYFALEGDTKAVQHLKEIIASFGGKVFEIAAELKPYHHIACVMVSNYVVVLMDVAVKLMDSAGLPQEQVKSILLPLMKNAVENMSNKSLSSALTGPIVRGDVQTIRRHIQLMEENKPELLELYVRLGLQTIGLARRQENTNPEKMGQLVSLLKSYLD